MVPQPRTTPSIDGNRFGGFEYGNATVIATVIATTTAGWGNCATIATEERDPPRNRRERRRKAKIGSR